MEYKNIIKFLLSFEEKQVGLEVDIELQQYSSNA
jgi:hypothetical protein